MSTSEIEVPESLAFYCASDANARAIEYLVSQLGSRASNDDLSWEELRQLHAALLAAFTTQVDYFAFCDDLWRACWADPLTKLGAKERPAKAYEGARRLDNCWDDDLIRYHDWHGGILFTSVGVGLRGEVVLGFHFEDENGSYELSDALALNDQHWQGAPDDNLRLTVQGIAPLRGERQLRLEPLRKATREALEALAAAG